MQRLARRGFRDGTVGQAGTFLEDRMRVRVADHGSP